MLEAEEVCLEVKTKPFEFRSQSQGLCRRQTKSPCASAIASATRGWRTKSAEELQRWRTEGEKSWLCLGEPTAKQGVFGFQ